MVDGMSISFDSNFDLGQNLAMFDRVEVVQGASGLMNGTGNPSAAINLVRKLPTAQPHATVLLETGSWNERKAMVDLAGPLNTAGTLRARVVVDAHNLHGFRDVVSSRKRTYYGVIEADVGSQTTLRLGASQQHNHLRDSLSLLPTAPDGSDLHLPRSTYLGYDWEYWRQHTTTAFAQLEHEWTNGWRLRADTLQVHADLDYLGTYLAGTDFLPGVLLQSLAQYGSQQRETSYALSLRGPWTWAGRQHQLAMGLSHRQGDLTGSGWTIPYAMGFLALDGTHDASRRPAADLLELLKPYTYRYSPSLRPTQTGLWLATQWALHDRLELTLGGRWDRYRHTAEIKDSLLYRTDARKLQHFSPYLGLVWKLNPQHSAYVQTSRIFQPRTERDVDNQVLPATEGRTYGAGLQGQYLDQRLQAGVHLFQVSQRHAPEPIYDQRSDCLSYPGITCYRTSEQVRSHGLTLQVQGHITPSWQLSASYTQVRSRYAQDPAKQGQRFETQLPRHQWQLATVYRVPDSAWRIGGSLYRQSQIASTGLDSLSGYRYTIRQPAYTLVGLMAARQITPQWLLQLNVRNLLDRRYYQRIDAPMFTSYGAPRSWNLSLRYQY